MNTIESWLIRPGGLAERLRELRKAFDLYTQTNKKLPREVLKSITSLEDPARMVDLITSHIQLRTEEKQSILELVSLP